MLDDGLRVNQSQQFDELMVCRLDERRKVVEPCSIIIFGASGDLTLRKSFLPCTTCASPLTLVP